MKVRLAAPTDGLGIASLIVRAAPHFDVKGYPELLLPRETLVLVAEEEGHVVGWLEGVMDGVYSGRGRPAPPPHGYVLAVVVDQAWRRQGIGRALLDVFVTHARTAGLEWVFLFPEEGEGMEERIAFLRATGFVAVDDLGEEHPAMGRWTQDVR